MHHSNAELLHASFMPLAHRTHGARGHAETVAQIGLDTQVVQRHWQHQREQEIRGQGHGKCLFGTDKNAGSEEGCKGCRCDEYVSVVFCPLSLTKIVRHLCAYKSVRTQINRRARARRARVAPLRPHNDSQEMRIACPSALLIPHTS